MKAKSTFERNQEITQLVQSQNEFTPAEKQVLQTYMGNGGQGKKGATGEGVLYEFYTPDWLCKLLWKLAAFYGFPEHGTVLEPSIATGALIADAPHKSNCYGFEINPISRKICQILYPEAQIYEGYFETAFLEPPRYATRLRNQFTWVKGYPFDLVIGNPPYGKYTNAYSAYFKQPTLKQIELFFFYYGLKMLKKGGLLIYLTSSNFLRNGLRYQDEKKEMEKIGAVLIDAYRLPKIFAFSDVPTDIVVLQKIV